MSNRTWLPPPARFSQSAKLSPGWMFAGAYLAPDLVSGVRNFFAGAAAHLEETDYADACPIATVALEVSSTSDTLREACADVFESWIEAGASRYAPDMLSEETARELTIGMLAALEGAFVLARALRSTEPLMIAGELVANAVQAAVEEATAEPGRPRRRAPSPGRAERGSRAPASPSAPATASPGRRSTRRRGR